MLLFLHLAIAAFHLVVVFFPLMQWYFTGEGGPEMVYEIGAISYKSGATFEPNVVENKPLLYLNLALVALHFALASNKIPKLLRPRLYNAAVLLGSALLFSIAVTAYRAEKSISHSLVDRHFAIGIWAMLLAVVLAYVAYGMARFGRKLGQQALAE